MGSVCYNKAMAKSETTGRERPENHVGIAIRKRRRELEMSQTTLANRMETSQEIISNYEIGVTPVKADDLPHFAEILDVPMDYFFSHIGSQHATKTHVSIRGNSVQLSQILQRLSEQILPEKTVWQPTHDDYGFDEQGRVIEMRPYIVGESQYFNGMNWAEEHELMDELQQLDVETRFVALTLIHTLLANQREWQPKTDEI